MCLLGLCFIDAVVVHFNFGANRWGKTDGIPNEGINHSADAIKIAQFTANFFVNEARKSTHKFASSEEEDAALIENYQAVPTTGSFMSTYFFHLKQWDNNKL